MAFSGHTSVLSRCSSFLHGHLPRELSLPNFCTQLCTWPPAVHSALSCALGTQLCTRASVRSAHTLGTAPPDSAWEPGEWTSPIADHHFTLCGGWFSGYNPLSGPAPSSVAIQVNHECAPNTEYQSSLIRPQWPDWRFVATGPCLQRPASSPGLSGLPSTACLDPLAPGPSGWRKRLQPSALMSRPLALTRAECWMMTRSGIGSRVEVWARRVRVVSG